MYQWNIYKGGVLDPSIMWTCSDNSPVINNGSELIFQRSSSTIGYIYFTSKIDPTPYKTLRITARILSLDETVGIGLSSSPNTSYDLVSTTLSTNSTTAVYNLESYHYLEYVYITVVGRRTSAGSRVIYISEIIAE